MPIRLAHRPAIHPALRPALRRAAGLAVGLAAGLVVVVLMPPPAAAPWITPAAAADLDGVYGPYGAPPRPRPRRVVPLYPVAPLARACPPPAWVTRAPTNAPDDPTYVGSVYGLGRPSYYGTTPPPGVDDPFGRRCP